MWTLYTLGGAYPAEALKLQVHKSYRLRDDDGENDAGSGSDSGKQCPAADQARGAFSFARGIAAEALAY